MGRLIRLRAAANVADLARILGIKPGALTYVIYQLPESAKYTTFKLKKKSGGERVIQAPDPRLKLIQTRLAALLYECQEEVEGELGVNPGCELAHGFKKKRSIRTNAVKHRNRRWVFNIDLKDFFPSINFGRVYGFFLKNKYYRLKPKVAAAVAQICCHGNELPQGAPSSPIVSNIIAHLLDMRLNELAEKAGCTYSRYADDITFSSNKSRFPSSIAKLDSNTAHKWKLGEKLVSCIRRSGFVVNRRKTRMQYCDSRQDVTGLVVNSTVNVKKEYYKTARAMCHCLVTTGECFRKVGERQVPVERDQLRGSLAYIYHIKSSEAERRNVALKDASRRTFHKVYEKYLNYDSFFGLERPTLVCEGKTDNVYLRCAMRSLATSYPSLVEVRDSKKYLRIKLFKFTNTAGKVQGISGGADQLNNLLGQYREKIKSFVGTPLHPTILVVDNDSGPDQLFKHLSAVLKRQVDGSEKFYFVYENLYVVPVPKVDGRFTAIEQLFDKSVLETKLDGKSLDLKGKEKDGWRFYSKHRFSIDVVQRNQANIDFSRFRPLLDAIQAAIADYHARITALAG